MGNFYKGSCVIKILYRGAGRGYRGGGRICLPTNMGADISKDFIGGLSRSKGMDTIPIAVDCLTKYAHFFFLAHPFTANNVASLFIRDVVRLHGFASSIVSDINKIFMSTFWAELFKQAGTSLRMTSAYHPQSNGQTKAVNKCLETYLRYLTGSKPKQLTACIV